MLNLKDISTKVHSESTDVIGEHFGVSEAEWKFYLQSKLIKTT